MMDYHRQNKVDIKIVRIFNTYGPRMAIDDGRVVSNFCVAALRGEHLTVYGEGKQTRSFAYIDDLVEGLVRMMDAPGLYRSGQSRQSRRIHHAGVGGDGDRVVQKLLPAGASGRCRPTIRRRRRPDISLARSASDWEPKIPLREGLRARWNISGGSWAWSAPELSGRPPAPGFRAPNDSPDLDART